MKIEPCPSKWGFWNVGIQREDYAVSRPRRTWPEKDELDRHTKILHEYRPEQSAIMHEGVACIIHRQCIILMQLVTRNLIGTTTRKYAARVHESICVSSYSMPLNCNLVILFCTNIRPLPRVCHVAVWSSLVQLGVMFSPKESYLFCVWHW
jgi:hypothetical protein